VQPSNANLIVKKTEMDVRTHRVQA
jgi:hypothetical protein